MPLSSLFCPQQRLCGTGIHMIDFLWKAHGLLGPYILCGSSFLCRGIQLNFFKTENKRNVRTKLLCEETSLHLSMCQGTGCIVRASLIRSQTIQTNIQMEFVRYFWILLIFSLTLYPKTAFPIINKNFPHLFLLELKYRRPLFKMQLRSRHQAACSAASGFCVQRC